MITLIFTSTGAAHASPPLCYSRSGTAGPQHSGRAQLGRLSDGDHPRRRSSDSVLAMLAAGAMLGLNTAGIKLQQGLLLRSKLLGKRDILTCLAQREPRCQAPWWLYPTHAQSSAATVRTVPERLISLFHQENPPSLATARIRRVQTDREQTNTRDSPVRHTI